MSFASLWDDTCGETCVNRLIREAMKLGRSKPHMSCVKHTCNLTGHLDLECMHGSTRPCGHALACANVSYASKDLFYIVAMYHVATAALSCMVREYLSHE